MGVCATARPEDASLSGWGSRGKKDWLLPSFIFWIWKEKGKDEAEGRRGAGSLSPQPPAHSPGGSPQPPGLTCDPTPP